MTTAFLTLCLLGIGQEPQDGKLLEAAHLQASAFAKAFQADDHAALAELTYPRAAALAGSKSRLVLAYKKKTAAYRRQGLRLEKYEVEAPKEIVKAGPDWVAVVPTKLSFQSVEGTASLKSYLLVLTRDQGKTWHIIDGADAETVKKVPDWLPKLAENLALPEVGKARVEKADARRKIFTSPAGNFKVAYPDRWDEAQKGKVAYFMLENADNAILVFVEEGDIAFEDTMRFYEVNRSTGKQRRIFGQKDMTVAGEKARYFRFDDTTDQGLQQFHVCAFNHQGLAYRFFGMRRGGEAKEFEEDFQAVLTHFAFLKDRAAWVKLHNGTPRPTALLGGLASFELSRPRWLENTFDNAIPEQWLDYATFRFQPGNSWLFISLHEAQASLAAELQEVSAIYFPHMAGGKQRAVTFTTTTGNWSGWEIKGSFDGSPRTQLIAATINDGIAVWIVLECTPGQLDEVTPDFEMVLESFRLKAQSKLDEPLAFPIRRYDGNRVADARLAALLKKATRLYPGSKSHEVVGFTADGKQAIVAANVDYYLEDLATKKRDALPVKGVRLTGIAVSADRKWLAWSVGDDITIAPLGFGFTRKVRVKNATSLAFGPGNKDLYVVTSNQGPFFDDRDDYGLGRGNTGMQYLTRKLELVPLDNRPKKALFDWPLVRVGVPVLSPDGTQLAVVANRDMPRTQQFGGLLYLAKPDGSDLRILNKDIADYQSVVWAADGKALYALRRGIRDPSEAGTPGYMFDLERIDAASGTAVKLTRSGRFSHMWGAGPDLFLEINDDLLPTAQQGIFRIRAEEIVKAAPPGAAPKPAGTTPLAERVAGRFEKALKGTPAPQYVPTPASLETLANAFADAVKDETGVVLDGTAASLDRLTNLIDHIELASGKHPVNILGVGAYYGETLRKSFGAKWHIKPVPFGSWAPVRVPPANNVADVVLPFSDTYGWAMYAGRLLNSRDLRERSTGQDWLLVYPPTHADAVLQAGYPDYFKAKKLTDQGDIDEALKLFAGEMKKRPKNAKLAREVVALCKAIERDDLARAYTKQAVEAGANARDLMIHYADELAGVDTGKAIVYYRKAANLPFADPTTLMKLGRAYQKNGELALAESCWRRAYLPASDPQRNELRRLMGMPGRQFDPSFLPGLPLDNKE